MKNTEWDVSYLGLFSIFSFCQTTLCLPFEEQPLSAGLRVVGAG